MLRENLQKIVCRPEDYNDIMMQLEEEEIDMRSYGYFRPREIKVEIDEEIEETQYCYSRWSAKNNEDKGT